MRWLFWFSLAAWVCGCAARAPVFYANAHYNSVGEAQAEKDLEECKRLADERVPSSVVGNVAGQTAVGGGAGAAIGAAGGAATGRAGSGAAAGAASGAVAGLLRGIFQSRRPNALERGYIEACLRERGYEIVGWR